jgi:opacity protein-like surface antigen
MPGTLPGYGAHAGIEFKPTSNVSLSLGFGYTQQ